MRFRAWKITGSNLKPDYVEEYWITDGSTSDEIWEFVRRYMDATGWEIIK